MQRNIPRTIIRLDGSIGPEGILTDGKFKIRTIEGNIVLSEEDSGMVIWVNSRSGPKSVILPGSGSSNPTLPGPGTHYRIICNTNSNQISIVGNDIGAKSPGANMYGCIAHGGPGGTFARSADSPTSSVTMGSTLAFGGVVVPPHIGDYIDVIYSNTAWYISGSASNTDTRNASVIFS